ncbi:N-acetyltransferase, putative [Psychroflexus torquis ATCC 700755]|uniref:N-acetyltransferase, putative n=2 Tax=Psychroflexus TaxID=83612 RepID=K4IQ56_PSYTT|nr:N-acetyltransferase, putative [Psychroflexus torquis ATCC 700755]
MRYISAEETLELRQNVLRLGKPQSSCIWKGDNLKSTKHIGAFVDSKCIGILSLFEANTDELSKTKHYQLRGMAVDLEYRGKGIGKQLVNFSEHELKALGIPVLWCNARISAEEFYSKLGFKVISKEFIVPDVGLHYRMSKSLI